MDTLIFGLILATFVSLFGEKRGTTIGLFLVSVCAAVMLFSLHMTDRLDLNF